MFARGFPARPLALSERPPPALLLVRQLQNLCQTDRVCLDVAGADFAACLAGPVGYPLGAFAHLAALGCEVHVEGRRSLKDHPLVLKAGRQDQKTPYLGSHPSLSI